MSTSLVPKRTSRPIEVQLETIDQLFNSMDPSPFHAKDLDRDADEFIVSWAGELPLDSTLTLRVHLETWPAQDPSELVRTAVHNHFGGRAKIAELELRRHLREARTSLIIGLMFLGLCLLAIRFVARGATAWGGYLAEGLTIAGWVAMWRPMQMYLYDWWPLRRRRRLYARLKEMPVEVVRRARE